METKPDICKWVSETLPADVEQALARLRDAEDVVAIAVMPDVHLADEVCVGTVMATRRLLYPNAVGGDISCGMAAIQFRGGARTIDRRSAQRLLAGFAERVPILKRTDPIGTDETGLTELSLSTEPLHATWKREGLLQLGTLGRGNHFLELQHDDEGELWLMVHSGSRGMGQRIRSQHLTGCERTASGLGYLDSQTQAGCDYFGDMKWALRYAAENRRLLVQQACEVIEIVLGVTADKASFFSCHHNHVVHEEGLFIHRKGAISAREGEAGIIPGSMGAPSYHVLGRGNPAALWSSSHGAGRCMSRSQARRRFSASAFREQVRDVWFDERRTRQLVDEAPRAYKDIEKVMRSQRSLTRVVRRLTPLLTYKGT